MAQERKRQHHVWRKYLEAWCTDGLLFCKNRGGECPFSNTPKNVAVEKYFYRIDELSTRDLAVIEASIDRYPASRRTIIHYHIDNIIIPILRWQASPNPKYKEKIDVYKTNALEYWHTNIENSFGPFLDDMQCGKLDFLEQNPAEMVFYNFVANQLLRTRKMKRAIIESVKLDFPNASFDNTWGLLAAATAINFGGNLYLERKTRAVLRLEAPGGHNFLTSDTPLINIAHLFDSPEGCCIFYPVSPRFALLISDADITHGLDGILKKSEIAFLNAEILTTAEFQTYATTNAELMMTV